MRQHKCLLPTQPPAVTGNARQTDDQSGDDLDTGGKHMNALCALARTHAGARTHAHTHKFTQVHTSTHYAHTNHTNTNTEHTDTHRHTRTHTHTHTETHTRHTSHSGARTNSKLALGSPFPSLSLDSEKHGNSADLRKTWKRDELIR